MQLENQELGVLWRGSAGPPWWHAVLGCAAIAALRGFESGSFDGALGVLPIVSTLFVVGVTGEVFSRAAFGRYERFPRSLRARYGLELALFRWTDPDVEGRPERRRAVLAHLAVARRSPCAGDLRTRIERISRRVVEAEEGDADRIERELRDAVRAAPAHRGVPDRRRRLFPEYLVRRLPVVAATASTAWQLLVRGKPALEDAELWLTVFLLVQVSLRLLFLVEDRARQRRLRRAFRTVLLTDLPTYHRTNRAAVEFYASSGHVLAIFVGAPDEAFTGHEWWGAETFAVSPQEPTRALEAFAEHADLVVLHTLDPTLAARVRLVTPSPEERCLAISEDGSAPQGFRWLDPMCLRLDPTRRFTQEDLHPAKHPHFGRIRPLLDSYTIYGWILSVPVLFSSWRCAPLGVLLGVALLGWLFPKLLGPRRRAAVSWAELRVPKNLATSRSFDAKGLQRKLQLLVFPVGLLCCALAFTRLDEHWYRSIWLWLLFSYVVLFTWIAIATGLVAGTLQAVKWYLDWNFRILVFRRNAFRFGFAHKAIVMATCGFYGHVIILQDSELGKTKQGFNSQREDEEGEWFEIFSENKYALDRSVFLHDWRIQVAAELEAADFAVFDWAEEVTENMRWELEAALERLPGDRILVVYDGEREEGVPELVARLNASTDRPIRSLAARREHDDQYIWQSHDAFRAAFGVTLTGSLATLHVEARPTAPHRPPSSLPLPV